MRRDLDFALGQPMGICQINKEATAWVWQSSQEEMGCRFTGNIAADSMRYLVVHLYNHQDYVEVLYLRFWEKGSQEPRIQLSVRLMAQMEAQVIFDMEDLCAQRRFLPLQPGSLSRYADGDSTSLPLADRMELGLHRGYAGDRKLTLQEVYWTDTYPTPLQAPRKNTDALGQWMDKDWPGKTKDEADLKEKLSKLWQEKQHQSFPQGWNAYGGQMPPRFAGSGFFRVEKDQNRWYMVDPMGCPFFSVGVFGVYPGEPGWILGNEGYLSWLPDTEGTYKDAFTPAGSMELYRRKFSGLFPDETPLFTYTTANMIRAFGQDWRTHWEEMTAGCLRQWGINTLSMFSDPGFIAHSKIPYVIMLEGFPVTKQTIFREFPDVFAPEYDALCQRFAKQLESRNTDPYLVGYFINNEPTWGFVRNINLAEKVLQLEAPTYSRQALIQALQIQYQHSIQQLNKAWHTHWEAWDALEKPIARAADFSDCARADLEAFTAVMVERYAELPCRYTRKAAPHHLNLGMRFAGLNNPSLLRTSKFFDVFSVNCYQDTPRNAMDQICSAGIDMPILVGEFHFGALDRGLPHPSLFAVPTQEARVEAYARYVTQAAAHPNAVGTHYFAYNDQPLWGRYDGENFQFGFVDVCGLPHEIFTQGIQKIHEQISAIHEGQCPPLEGHTERM